MSNKYDRPTFILIIFLYNRHHADRTKCTQTDEQKFISSSVGVTTIRKVSGVVMKMVESLLSDHSRDSSTFVAAWVHSGVSGHRHEEGHH